MMQETGMAAPQAGNDCVLFASSRPSRTGEVLCSEEQLAVRRLREQEWAERIGMDIAALNAADVLRTGSPTGSKPPHTKDDYIEDIGV
jgi:hypothetical protein